MDRPLVVFDEDDTELLTEAGELAAGVDAELTVLSLMAAEEFMDGREALDVVAQEENTSYDDSVVVDAARRQASEVAEDLYADMDLEWEVVGARIGDNEKPADRILQVAEESDVDHLFVTGEKRSPTGKAVFGDRAQSLILNFDGPVTTLLE